MLLCAAIIFLCYSIMCLLYTVIIFFCAGLVGVGMFLFNHFACIISFGLWIVGESFVRGLWFVFWFVCGALQK